jgi:hypothetical protein
VNDCPRHDALVQAGMEQAEKLAKTRPQAAHVMAQLATETHSLCAQVQTANAALEGLPVGLARVFRVPARYTEFFVNRVDRIARDCATKNVPECELQQELEGDVLFTVQQREVPDAGHS